MTNNSYTPLFQLTSDSNQQPAQQQPTAASQTSKPYFYDQLEDLVDPQELIIGPRYFGSHSTHRLEASQDVKAYQNSRIALAEIHCLNDSAIASSSKILQMEKEKIILRQDKINASQKQIKKKKSKSQQARNSQKTEKGTLTDNPLIVQVVKPIVPIEPINSIRTPIESARPHNSNVAQGKREDDSNNAHKKMITRLTKAINLVSSSGLKFKLCPNGIKALPQKQVKLLRDIKSSRYGFIAQLCAIQYTHGELFLQKVFEVFQKHVLQEFKIQISEMKDSPSKQLLLRLPQIYISSYKAFLMGDIEQATELIYKIDKESFKQKSYLDKGLNIVIGFRNQLLKLN